jgi:hypothetical protein
MAMQARFLVLTTAALAMGAAAIAEPAKAPAGSAGQAPQPPVQIVLASADEAQPATPQNAQPTATPIKRRVARVTTCRCGDQQADPEQQDQ